MAPGGGFAPTRLGEAQGLRGEGSLLSLRVPPPWPVEVLSITLVGNLNPSSRLVPRLPRLPGVYSHQGRHKWQHHAVYDTNPVKFRTLQNILEVEKEMYGAQWPKVGATLALMWLKRGLRFIQVFLQSICDGERDENHPNHIRINATKAYEMALKKYHGWVVQKIFQAALYAAPYKSDFLKALSKGQPVTEEECLEKTRLFLVNFTATIDVIYEMYTKMNAELSYKV
ncbi:hypothetical protein HPG69_019230 [Diceros bicornis minor]|uniref:Glycolipid transfer protein n=1 Tax=Diceros bicornis minor TaxID=77932 RepID=A0A7J7FMC4_DICBM|nr:hypothetical protein HPG69_019230 [Diceros bicornis minor]